jgi:hypothetical protein
MGLTNSLDLHGVRHQDVDLMVENFILMHQHALPLTVICGNSVKMIQLVAATINRIGCEWTVLRYGFIVVHRIK